VGHGGTGDVPSALSVVFEGGQGGTGLVPSHCSAGFRWLEERNIAEDPASDMQANRVRQQSFRNIVVPPFCGNWVLLWIL
jgi:hypothetical protein